MPEATTPHQNHENDESISTSPSPSPSSDAPSAAISKIFFKLKIATSKLAIVVNPLLLSGSSSGSSNDKLPLEMQQTWKQFEDRCKAIGRLGSLLRQQQLLLQQISAAEHDLSGKLAEVAGIKEEKEGKKEKEKEKETAQQQHQQQSKPPSTFVSNSTSVSTSSSSSENLAVTATANATAASQKLFDGLCELSCVYGQLPSSELAAAYSVIAAWSCVAIERMLKDLQSCHDNLVKQQRQQQKRDGEAVGSEQKSFVKQSAMEAFSDKLAYMQQLTETAFAEHLNNFSISIRTHHKQCLKIAKAHRV